MHLQWFASLILIVNPIITSAFPELLFIRPDTRARALRYSKPPPEVKRFLEGVQRILSEHQNNPKTLRENLQRYLKENQPKQSDTEINNENRPVQSGTENFRPPKLPLETWQWMCSFPGCIVPSMDVSPFSKQFRPENEGKHSPFSRQRKTGRKTK